MDGDDFTDLVVVITGAGRGLGRHYALDLGRRGARVVVVARDSRAASRVVETIRDHGGVAVEAVADARDGRTPVAVALEAFGRVDGVIANAGHVRDRSFARMSDDDWHDVVDVHLGGARAIASAAWPVMSEQRGGRIVFTGSGAGLHGNRGQANYAAAKAGVLGLSATLADEGASRGIGVNVVLPMALTDMTLRVFDPEQQAALPAEDVSPVVLALVHPACPLSGEVLETGGGWVRAMRWERSAGVRMLDAARSPADVGARWVDITHFDDRADHPRSIVDSLQAALGRDQ